MKQKAANERIAEALMAMAESRRLEELRVSDIIARAGVSRATFYRYFQDKYDVVNWIYQHAVQPTVDVLPDLSNMKIWSYTSFAYIKKHKRFFRSIISYQGQNSFFDYQIKMYSKNSIRSIQERTGREVPDEIRFAIEAFSCIGAYATEKWIKDDCRMDEDTLLKNVMNCIPECLRPFYAETSR